MKNEFEIRDLTVNGISTPLGTDQIPLLFGWRMEASGYGRFQKAYRIEVRDQEEEKVVWDSGKVEQGRSTEIIYQGENLKSCTRYSWTVWVWNEKNRMKKAESWFETGLMDTTRAAWSGAKFISTPGQELCASVKGIFCIEAEIKFLEGCLGGGIVFGKNDKRLLDSAKNIYGVFGENYISYVIDIRSFPAKLNIYRVGYAVGDKKNVPFASVPIPFITQENYHDYHKIRIEVYGNHAKAFIDDYCVDEDRVLNPLGINDVITFPHLNEIGIEVECGEICIGTFSVRNIRKPSAVLLKVPCEKEFREIEEKFIQSGLTKKGKELVAKAESRSQFTINPDYGSIPWLRRKFYVPAKPLKKVRLYATARGIYEGEVNGQKISDIYFAPGASQFDKHLYYQTYDITEKIRHGENEVDFFVASGWWSDAQTYTLMNYNYYGDKPSMIAKLHLWYADGTEEIIVTDTNCWECSKEGPIVYAGFFNGEHYDARKKMIFSGKTQSIQGSLNWLRPQEIEVVRIDEQIQNWPIPNKTEPEFIGQVESGVRAINSISAKERMEPRKGVYVYDMGQNMAGIPRVKFHEKEGQVITIRYGEILYPELEAYKGLGGMILTENLRDADCTDIYICGGEEEEIYTPRFTYHGYRYIEISGIVNPPELEEVEGVVLSSIERFCGNIETSDADVNRLFENICWSQKANFISIPTDCPQRNKRMGWLGDAQVFVRTAISNAQLQLFFRRYLQAIRDLQTPEGKFQDIAPVGGGFGGIAWGSAGVIIPWELYLRYGSVTILRENCDAILRYGEYLNRHRQQGLVNEVGFLGDWLAVDESTDCNLLWDAIYAYVLKVIFRILKILGKKEADLYYNLYEETKLVWNKTYVDPDTKRTCSREGVINDTQCSYALPLVYDLFSEENREKAGEYLNRKTVESGYRLMTGFLGTGMISEALCSCGYAATAYQLLEQKEYPSWLYSVKQGATTIWERWDSYTDECGFGQNNAMNSFNHYSLGAVGAWMYSHMLGIRVNEEYPGFQKFILEPIPGNLKFAKGFYESAYGKIESGWRNEGENIVYQVVVPANTSAELRLPDGTVTDLLSGEYEFVVKNR